MPYFQDREPVDGEFTEVEYGHTFEYRKSVDAYGMSIGATHTVAVGDPIGKPSRYARVLKTVAYIATDEDDCGVVWEKWRIKNNREYVKR